MQTIEPGTGFAEAVWRLAGEPTATPQRPRPAPKREPPRLPRQTQADREAGRRYLEARGISPATIIAAEDAGMLAYARGACLFVGRDEAGGVAAVTRRAIEADAETPKRDLAGTDKSFAPILPGGATVWIVEGGVDALAVQDGARWRGEELPTVIVSGGAQVRSWVDRCSALLRSAAHIVLTGERERSDDAQARADAGHDRQAAMIAAITGRPVERWTPRGDKDVAAMHERQVREAKARLAAQVEELDEPEAPDETPRPGCG